MPFPELMVRPMREELTRIGLAELKDPAAVDAFMASVAEGTALIAVNSTCGCAAGSMRPALAFALRRGPRPKRLATVFAGQDAEATAKAREYFTGYAPSSPSMALFRDGKLVWMMERSEIQGRAPEHLAEVMVEAFENHCGAAASGD